MVRNLNIQFQAAVVGQIKSYVFACLIILSSGAYAQQGEAESGVFRRWTSAQGTAVEARLVEQDAESVSLLIAGRPDPVKLRLEQLSHPDQLFLRTRWLNQQDHRQFELIKEHLRSVNEQPHTVSRLLIEVHNQIPESPYAGLWAAVTVSGGQNEHVRAAVILEQTIKRIERQQEVDSNRHRMTLCSAYNNLAVCLIKGRKGDSAASRMVAAIEATNRTPSVVRANASLLNELTSSPASAITFGAGARQRLMRSVAMSETVGSGTNLEPGWHYTLDFDVPSDSNAAVKLEGVDAPRSDLELLSTGTGFVVAPGIVLTARPVVETTNYRGPKLITIVSNPQSASRRSETVQNLLVTATRSVATSATVYSGSRGNVGVWTEYSYVHPQNGQMGAEIAALRVPNLALKPVEVAIKSPKVSSNIRILGFVRGQGAVGNGLKSQDGLVLNQKSVAAARSYLGEYGSGVKMETTARVLGGNRGGPVLDTYNRVVGIAYDTPVSSSDANGIFFGSGEFRRWFYDNVQTSALQDASDETSAAERLERVKQACVAVYCWGPKQKSNSQLFSDFTDSSRESGGLSVRDNWCLACDGKGFLDCPVKGCIKGVVSTRGFVAGELNIITGQRMKRPVVGKEKCSGCKGKGGAKCPHCTGGKI